MFISKNKQTPKWLLWPSISVGDIKVAKLNTLSENEPEATFLLSWLVEIS